MKNSKLLIIIVPLLFLIACNKKGERIEVQPKQLNVSILLDLSDRINKQLHPFQAQLDKENIERIITLFKRSLDSVGVYDAIGKMRIVFYPPPTNNDIITIAKNLNVDFAGIESSTMEGVSGKINLAKTFDTCFSNNIDKLYSYSSENKEYFGADIWTFFKDEIEDQCVIKDTNFRNILIILTDGYLYWDKNVRNISGNRYTYLTESSPHLIDFRNKSDWEERFDQGDFGFGKIKKDLNRIEILVLGINPVEEQDFDIIKKYWYKWFVEMNVKSENIKIVKTELPLKTDIIDKFFEKR